jgi:flagellar protein FlgJ
MDARLQRAIAPLAVPARVQWTITAPYRPLPPVPAPHVRKFQQKLVPQPKRPAAATGIPAKFMLGQAALESGWGKREIKGRDGSNSHNLFGIKASGDWKGKVVEATTTEYVNGKAQTRVERFRAYDSYADSSRTTPS